MSQAKCGSCGAIGQFDLEEVHVGVVTESFNVHHVGWTLFKCAACGAVLGVVEGSVVSIARAQQQRAGRS